MKTERPTGISRVKRQATIRQTMAPSFMAAGLLLLVFGNRAAAWNPYSTNAALDYWSFSQTNWISDYGSLPARFTNVLWSPPGIGAALEVNSNAPAYIGYPVLDTNAGLTNLTAPEGSFIAWVSPASWASTNSGGLGPGVPGRIFEVGAYTTNASVGWFSLYLDASGCNLYFSAQTNDGTQATFLTAPISWTTQRFCMVALTWSSTNSALYLNGNLVTNGLPVTCYPGPEALTNFYVGSDETGTNQSHCILADIATFAFPLDAAAISNAFFNQTISFWGNPENWANDITAPFGPSETPFFDQVTGAGLVQFASNAVPCVTNLNVWLTNVVAEVAPDTSINLKFTVMGGVEGLPYDVFGTGELLPPKWGSAQWAWLGQAYTCGTYLLTNMPPSAAYLVLGWPTPAPDGDGMTIAYERLVNKTDPNNANSAGNNVINQPFQVFITTPQNGRSIP